MPREGVKIHLMVIDRSVKGGGGWGFNPLSATTIVFFFL